MLRSMRPLAPLASVLLTALLLRLFALSGEMGPDSTVYAQYAWNLLHGEFSLESGSWYAHRLPVFAPVSLLYAAAGAGKFSTVAWPLLLSLAQVATAFWLGRRLFGTPAGWIAGLVLATLPLDAIEATRLMPDVIFGALMGIAGALWMGGAPGRRTGLGAGVLLALATVVRPYALLLAPLFVVDAWFVPDRRRALPWVAAGLAIVILPLLSTYAIQTGDPLYRWRVVSDAYGSGVMAEGAEFGFYPRLLTAWWKTTGLHAALLVGCVLVALVSPGRDRARLLAWIGVLFAFLQFGSMSLSEWVPILKRVRFLTILSLPSAVLIGSVVAGLAGWTGETRRWIPRPSWLRSTLRAGVCVGLAGLLALCIWRIDLDRTTRVPRNAAFETIGDLMRGEPAVTTDHWRTAIRLAYYSGFEAGAHYYHGADDRGRMDRAAIPAGSTIGYLQWFGSAAEVPAGLVVLDAEAMRDLEKMAPTGRTYAGNDIPAWALEIPEDWTLQFEGAGLRVYRIPPTPRS